MWKILQRNRRWVSRCTISEAVHTETGQRRFSATIDGWQNWRLLVVDTPLKAEEVVEIVTTKVRAILERIDANDETVFDQTEQAW